MKKLFTIPVFILLLGSIFAANPVIIRHQFNWDAPEEMAFDGQMVQRLTFEGSISHSQYPHLPWYISRFPIEGNGRLKVQIIRATFESFDKTEGEEDALLGERLNFETQVEQDRQQYYGRLAFIPIIKKGSRFERLKEIELRIELESEPIAFRGPGNTTISVLSSGTTYKLAIVETGIHRLSYTFLKDALGVDVDNIDPRKIRLYGNGSGMLPTFVSADRVDDLEENAILVMGESDGSFDAGDYILFYAEGPDKWSYDETLRQFVMEKNIYDTRNYYFLKIDSENGLRVSEQASLGSGAYTSTSFDDYTRLEEDKSNLMHDWNKTQGSGQFWYGDHFKVAREYSYNGRFNFPNLITTEATHIRAVMALRAAVSSNFYLDIAGESIKSGNADGVSSIGSANDNTRRYANRALLQDSVYLGGSVINFNIRYPYPQGSGDDSEGWLDYVQFNVRRQLRMVGLQMRFRDTRSTNYPSTTFQLLDVNAGIMVWDITDPLKARQQTYSLFGSQLSFAVNSDQLREFVAFTDSPELPEPEIVGELALQNVHGIEQTDMLIVYPSEFESEALRLAQHRANHDDLSIELVEVGQVYNEFSSGKKDPTAIRDLAKMLYERSSRFSYLLLFGDGSFDARDYYGLGNEFIPVYQKESLHPVEAYPTDDYFGLLTGTDPNEPLTGMLNIAVGRLTVKSLEEAAAVVDKIIHYDIGENTQGDWRNRMVFVGDDNDGSGDLTHFKDCDEIAEALQVSNPQLNYEKIYLDAFPQESTSGGERFPLATEQLNKSTFKGALAITYLGHGGPKGWAQERVLNISDILSWTNYDRLPIFLTATCSFTGYDDPAFTSAGEEVLLNSRGGAIALMTTVRAVYANSNVEMTENALQYMFNRESGRIPTIGEAFQRGKNDVSGIFDINNSRKFSLIGDPSTVIALPDYQVATTSINSQDVNTAVDTIRALQKVTIEGMVTDLNGQMLSGFNGIIYPTVFDKAQIVSTLGQGANPVYNYRIQKNVIFKGRASVTNGRFSFTFVVPKDINYTYGYGKVSYYAADDNSGADAAGSFEGFVIGGTDPDGLADDRGPQVEVYMNTEDFVFGGITDPSPTLLVVLEDDNGINVAGNSIGHDLEGILNEDTQNTYLLNDFYESELDNYTKGKVRYPLSSLPEGRHNISVKAWDVANNSATGYTEFVVASSEEIALEHVLNYPNPFTDRTCFQFDHNLANQELDVLIQVFTVSGRLVKTLEVTLFSDGAIRQDDCIEWDGRDDFGDQLAKGVYLYKVKVRTANTGLTTLNGESDFEKLVILK
ncbi:MAG TPA: type IX secretion system sortase PorU [Saprospiraceae bacterium]|nr:type IX secretion system sortase PorU [Saprospiraceae bacterium]HMQ85510.1 type IX secretion system sortase PorU [Saprospiraceae bacterium]